MTDNLWLWIYVAAMALGALTFFVMSRDPRGVPQSEYLIALAIPVWSGLVYTALALGQGRVEVGAQTTYYARYIDWIVTTPLLLVALAFTAMHGQRKNVPLILSLVFADVVMIASGLVADLSVGPARTVWFINGVVAFVVALALIWGPLYAVARDNGGGPAGVFRTAGAVLTVLWFAYPIIWLLGPSGVGAISQAAETVLFVIVPILSKVGFSLVDLSGLRGLHARERRAAMN